MDNKLKELTDKLYGEGLEKGRAEAERLVADAEAKAAKIVAEPRSRLLKSSGKPRRRLPMSRRTR